MSFNFPNEIKITDGIYITKPNLKSNSQSAITLNKDTPKHKYVFKSTSELINLLELEFDQLGNQIKRIHRANLEIEDYIKECDDPDLIQARRENLEIIERKLERLNEIKNELKNLCPTNPYVTTPIHEYFQINSDQVDDTKDVNGNVEITGIISNNADASDKEEPITEIIL